MKLITKGRINRISKMFEERQRAMDSITSWQVNEFRDKVCNNTCTRNKDCEFLDDLSPCYQLTDDVKICILRKNGFFSRIK